MKLDTDAIIWSAPERERAGRPLVVLLHGYGSHEGDLFGLSPRLPLGPVVASLRAPIAESGGYAWWGHEGGGIPGSPAQDAVNLAADAVLAWLDTQEYTSVSALGFSQGGVVALQLLRRAPERFAATVCLAASVAPGDEPGDAQLAATRPPVFWGRGTLDQVIPAFAVEHTEQWLPQHSTATIRIYEGVGHSLSSEELGDFSAFLAEHGA